MAVQANFRNQAYGRTNALQNIATPPIVSVRAPTQSDYATLGTIWINTSGPAYYVMTSSSGGVATWTAQSSGAGVFPTVDVNGVSGTVLTVDTGDTVLGGALTVAGAATFAGTTTVNGNLVANGDFTLSSSSAISLDTTSTLALEGDAGITLQQ